MVKKVSIFVEGGGDNKPNWIILRRGFSVFLKELVGIADRKNIIFQINACGPRGTAKKDFFKAMKSNTDEFNVLLVDSESPLDVDKAP